MADRGTALEREAMAIRGVRSELILDAGVITIRKEATTQANPTQVQIPVRTVRGATVEAPKRGGRGWLHIASTNGSPAPVGELAASGDPYALPITSRNLSACRKLAKMVDKHVRERGLPADVGPNQGRFTSGVVVGTGVKKVVAAPMVTVPDEEAPASEDSPPPPAKPSDEPKPVAKRAAAKKAVKKAAVKKATSRSASAKKSAASSSTAPPAAANELVAQLRELGELRAAGVLDDAEFAAAKAKLLG